MKTQRDKTPTDLSKQIEIAVVWATAIISVSIALLDFLGALDSIPWVSERIPTLTLLAVGLLASYIALERRNQLQIMHKELVDAVRKLAQDQEKSTSSVIQSLHGVEVRTFTDGYELLSYVNKKVASSSKRIDDVSWRPTFFSKNYGQTAQAPNREFPDILRNTIQRTPYREILIFNKPGRKEKIYNVLKENLAGYSCAYFDEQLQVPLFQFMIIDQEEVIIFGDLVSSSISIRHPIIVESFGSYYEEAWQKAQKLKIGKTIHWDNVRSALGDKVVVELNSELH
jgi:hypothetical protein